ncbi:hypothetical protein ZIOFF_075361 [Zingiber officinale]|uniref:Polygalacturonase n=1 Tax=Zingiber officinale TaxID=94328 RepID=A0A8J5ERJ8_ZINOF|nr:hypothetical protein ZIOFF_075361 [Zingiber officinale]
MNSNNGAIQLAISLLFSIWCTTCVAGQSGNAIYNVKDHGALGNGQNDDTKAFQAAWDASCAIEGNPTILIPMGSYLVGPLHFKGPCKSAMAIDLRGQLLASTHLNAYTKDWIEFQYINGLVISGGGIFHGQGSSAWPYNECPKKWKNFDIESVTISAPGDSPNTDGIHIADSTNVTITNATIGTGDDCISIGPGNSNLNISNVHCGPGHGISVGSLGKNSGETDVVGLTVKNCTLNATTNGLRIKTWQSSPSRLKAAQFTYQDITMNNVYNPIIIDQEYCPYISCAGKDPSRVQIYDIKFTNVKGTSSSAEAIKFICSSSFPCQGVVLNDIDLRYTGDATGNKTTTSTCANVRGKSNGNVKPNPCI